MADRLGYYGCYSADEIYHKDAGCCSRRRQAHGRIRLGPCAASKIMRAPRALLNVPPPSTARDGRAEVVFGIGNIAMLEQYGVEWRGTRPMARLGEALR